MKVVTVLGARPQFIKAATVSRAITLCNQQIESNSKKINEIIIHTGQHFDRNMSEIFFNEMHIPRPQYYLNINGLTHGAMTGQMLQKIEEKLQFEKPNLVLVYGDTNSTLAGALAATKLHIPVAHVEAGLRSFNKEMPEEINRILTDHSSTWLFCPTDIAVQNLNNENINIGVRNVGDVMFDAFLFYKKIAKSASNIMQKYTLNAKQYYVATVHREENTENFKKLKSILTALNSIAKKENPVIFPIHPRTRKILEENNSNFVLSKNIKIIEPIGYIDMVILLGNSRVVFTDSGGLQKEAYFSKVPCITMRTETEWIETLNNNCNNLTGADKNLILSTFHKISTRDLNFSNSHYGDGNTASKILKILLEEF